MWRSRADPVLGQEPRVAITPLSSHDDSRSSKSDSFVVDCWWDEKVKKPKSYDPRQSPYVIVIKTIIKG
jgi:hypothetical protein